MKIVAATEEAVATAVAVAGNVAVLQGVAGAGRRVAVGEALPAEAGAVHLEAAGAVNVVAIVVEIVNATVTANVEKKPKRRPLAPFPGSAAIRSIRALS